MTTTKVALQVLSRVQVSRAGGFLLRCTHPAKSTACDMTFSIFLPPQYSQRQEQGQGQETPVLFFLSGLTCTDQNFCQKAGPMAFRAAADHGLAVVVPDTSPRGSNVATDQAYDLGQGAGFYINATAEPWQQHYQMESYIQHELPELVNRHWPGISNRLRSVIGHSMGGHGSLTLAFKSHLQKNQHRHPWISTSALAPICHPTQCPWGDKVFRNYLGVNDETCLAHDATAILSQLSSGHNDTNNKNKNNQQPLFPNILIDQGLEDEFLKEQLRLDDFERAAAEANQPLTVRRHVGLDHSYYFIADCIADHVDFHAHHLQKATQANSSKVIRDA